jgi:imidazole glycerol phosphate synthase glutamine amidotransferase subunit
VRVALIDYGAGNLPSVDRAFRRLGAATVRAHTADTLDGAEAIVLPGVGHFASMMRTLTDRQLVAPLRKALTRGVPFLGICLGLQALYESSEEALGHPGLGLLCGTVRRLAAGVKLPHMGWDQLRPLRRSRLLRGIGTHAHFYFAHSFAATAADGAAAAVCDYGEAFAALVERENLFAVQFHPEKSGEAGQRMLKNFLEAAR